STHRRRRLGLERFAGAPVRQIGHEGRGGGAPARKSGSVGAGGRRQGFHLRRDRSRASRKTVRRCRGGKRRARRGGLQCQLPHPRAVRRSRSGRGRARARGDRLWRLSGRPAGRQAHGAEGPRRDHAHRGFGGREGLSAVGDVRHGQVRAAGAGAKHGAGTAAAGHPRRPYCRRRRHFEPAPAQSARQAGRHARSRRHRADLSRFVAAAPQRLGLGDRAAALAREVLNPALRPDYNRMMLGTFAKAALLTIALVAATSADAQTRRKREPREAAPPPVPAVSVDKRDSTVAAPGPFNGKPYWLALAQCGGAYFKLNVFYTDVATRARVKPDPKTAADYTKKLTDAIKTATMYFNGAERFLMTDRGVERVDAVLTYDPQSRA